MIKTLNPECFRYENYESSWWSLFDLSYEDSIYTINLNHSIKEYAIGYCMGELILFKPRDDSMAVMFEREGDTFWFHIPKWQFCDIFTDEKAMEELRKISKEETDEYLTTMSDIEERNKKWQEKYSE